MLDRNMRKSYSEYDLRKEQPRPDAHAGHLLQWLKARFVLEGRLGLQPHQIRQDFHSLQRAIANYPYFTDTQLQELNAVIDQYRQAVNTYREVIRTAVDAELQASGTGDEQVINAYREVRTAADQANDTLRQSVLEHELDLQSLVDIQRDFDGLQQGIKRYQHFSPKQRQELNSVADEYWQAMNTYKQAMNTYEQARGAKPYRELIARQQILDADQQIRTAADRGWDVMWQVCNANKM